MRVLKVARKWTKLISRFLYPKDFDFLTFWDLYEGGRYILPSSDGGRRMFSWDCDGKCFPCRGLWWKAGEVGTEATGYTCCFAFRQDFVPEKELLQSLWEKYWIYRVIFKILTPRINCCKKMWRKNRIYRIIILLLQIIEFVPWNEQLRENVRKIGPGNFWLTSISHCGDFLIYQHTSHDNFLVEYWYFQVVLRWFGYHLKHFLIWCQARWDDVLFCTASIFFKGRQWDKVEGGGLWELEQVCFLQPPQMR